VRSGPRAVQVLYQTVMDAESAHRSGVRKLAKTGQIFFHVRYADDARRETNFRDRRV